MDSLRDSIRRAYLKINDLFKKDEVIWAKTHFAANLVIRI